jgi:gluconolactonase
MHRLRRFCTWPRPTEGKLGAMSFPQPLRLVTIALALVLAACGSNSRPGGFGGQSGSAGAGAAGVGNAGSNGNAGSGSAGANGNAGSGSAGSGNAGSGSAGVGSAGSGSAGSGNAGSGSAGANADGGSAGSTGTPDGGAPHKQFTCPDGPFPAQSMGAATQMCTGFHLNYDYNEGPTWIASENAFFFSNFVHSNPGGMAGGDIVKVPLTGPCEIWAHDVGTNGLAVSATGNILGACHKTRSITEFNIKTKEARIVADMYMGQKFDSPNDLVSHSNGTIYFTNPTYELGGRPQGVGPAIFRIDPAGVVSLITKTGGQPNGIGLSPDETKLYVVGGGVWNLDAMGVPTTKSNEGGPGGDGFATDCANRITNTGTNSAYGGPDGKTLISVGGGITTYKMTVPGLP